MTHIPRNSKYAFLAVSKIEGLGFCGGLLLLTSGGRPIEFHCTAPVSANRAQEILYGATLEEFLVCDQIGEALLKKAKAKPDVILIDDRRLFKLSEAMSLPVALICQTDSTDTATDQISLVSDNDSQNAVSASILEIDDQPIEIVGADRGLTEGLLKLFVETLPLNEPFERIYQAINEAHSEAA